MSAINDIYRQLVQCYYTEYAPPNWTLSYVGSPEYFGDAKKSVLWGDVAMAVEREPVNIASKRYYYKRKLKKYFGWKHSAHQEHWDSYKLLGPVVSIYCHTPIKNALLNTKVNIMNSVGIALDDKQQPDYKFFKNIRNRKHRLIKFKCRLEEAYLHLFQQAIQSHMKEVVLCFLGGGAFSEYFDELFPTVSYLKDCYIPCVCSALEKTKYKHKISIIGVEQNVIPSDKLKIHKYYEHFPNFINDIDTKFTLIQNAWDPHSIAGNGNASDNSLDGYMGRCTAIGALCWRVTNPYMKKMP